MKPLTLTIKRANTSDINQDDVDLIINFSTQTYLESITIKYQYQKMRCNLRKRRLK